MNRKVRRGLEAIARDRSVADPAALARRKVHAIMRLTGCDELTAALTLRRMPASEDMRRKSRFKVGACKISDPVPRRRGAP